jgi:protein-disulfide isomerase
MRNCLFLCAVSVATLVNCATHQAGKPVASSNIPSACRGNCPPGTTTALAEGKVPEQAKPVADDVERYRIPLEGPFQGAVNARVNIVAFSDFQCPFCSQAAETMRLLLKQYPDDVRLYFRHLPLPFHADASLAAQAAMAADAQGKFWQMHDKLFANQENLKRADLETYARDIGLDGGRFTRDLDQQTWAKVVAADAALASQMGVVGTPNFFINGRLLRGALPIDSFQGIIEDEIIRSKKMLAAGTPPEGLYAKLMAGARSEPPPPPPPPRPPVSNEVYQVEIGKAPRKGGQQPKITLIEFADFQCPFCARAKNTLDELLKTYKDDLEIVFRHFPLPFHSNAMPAAIAAVAADQQGKFWEMHDKLFANQQNLDAASLEKYAQEIGLDMTRFKAALASPQTKAVVEADRKQVDQFAVQGTPSFFVNGRAFSGAYPLESFKMVLDEELKKADAKLRAGTPRGEIYAAIIKDGLAKREMPKEQARPGEPSPTETYKAEIKGAPVKGAKDALVTIVQFADFQCPFSSRVQSTIDKIMAEYKGKVRVAWRNKPLPFHDNAKPAAIAAMAANQQGKFWPMHAILFKNQHNLDAASLEKYAKEIGLNMTKFKAALRDRKLQDSVEADAAMGDRLGARGTPAFFINGKFLSGAQPFENFKSRIDEELKHAQKLVAGGTPKANVYAVILKDARAEVAKPAPDAPAPSQAEQDDSD